MQLLLPQELRTHGGLEVGVDAEGTTADRKDGAWGISLSKVSGTDYWGRLDVLGVPNFSGGTVHAHLEGFLVSGTVVDEYGTIVAKFDGEVTITGRAAGRFVSSDGREGAWNSKWP